MRLALFLAWSISVVLPAFAQEPFPLQPDSKLTPGMLCDDPSEYRYQERIAYCRRSVGSVLKKTVIQIYDEELGYNVGRMDRKQFKIDHYIPLCMGGSNEPSNLWPQHETVYRYTDLLENLACQKMQAGRLLQADAVEIIRRAKANPAVDGPKMTEYVISL